MTINLYSVTLYIELPAALTIDKGEFIMNHLRFKGNHYEIGYRWGSLLAGYGNYILDQVPFPITEERIAFGRQCRPVYEKFFPEILEEIRGLSEGQKSSSEKLQAVLFSMYAMPPAGHCSCFSVSSKEQLFLGRNSDFLTEIEEFNKNVIYDFTSDSYGFNGNTTAFLEIEDGINERGLAVGMTSVFPKHIQPGMNSGMLLRFFLEKCSTVDEVIKWLHRIPIASAQTFTVADQMGDISVIECCADSIHIRKPEEGQPYVCAVNRFHSPELEKWNTGEMDDWLSSQRYETMEKTLSREAPQMDISAAKELLSGEKGFLCQYDRDTGKDTVWSVIYDLKHHKIYRAEGNPARSVYQEDQRMVFQPNKQ